MNKKKVQKSKHQQRKDDIGKLEREADLRVGCKIAVKFLDMIEVRPYIKGKMPCRPSVVRTGFLIVGQTLAGSCLCRVGS